MQDKEIYYHVMGTEYEMIKKLPKSMEKFGKGESLSLASPKLSVRVPLGFSHIEIQSCGIVHKAQNVNINSP